MSIQEGQLQNIYDGYDYNNSIKKQIIDIIGHGLKPEVAEIKAYEIIKSIIGQVLENEHPDEINCRAENWLQERRNWIAEVDILRNELEKIKKIFNTYEPWTDAESALLEVKNKILSMKDSQSDFEFDLINQKL